MLSGFCEDKGASLLAHATNFVFLDRFVDLLEHGVDVGKAFVEFDVSGQNLIRLQ